MVRQFSSLISGTADSGQTTRSGSLVRRIRSGEELPEAGGVLVGVPDDGLRDARLNQRDVQRVRRGNTVVHAEQAGGEACDDDDQRGRFPLPTMALGRVLQNDLCGAEQGERKPDDEKGDTVDAGDGRELDERDELVLRDAKETPGEAPRTGHGSFRARPTRRRHRVSRGRGGSTTRRRVMSEE